MIPGRDLPAYVSYDATLVRHADAPDECIIRPGSDPDVSESAWISAEAGSFCLPSKRA